MFSRGIFATAFVVGGSKLVLVHPDPNVIPDDGGALQYLGYPLIVHRDPSASIPDLVAEGTIGVVFAAQLDSELPLQICQIAAQGMDRPHCPVFFWGPGGSAPHLHAILSAGASDCFPETMASKEVAVRISHRLTPPAEALPTSEPQDLEAAFNKRVRRLAHDLKNPLCVLYGYAQMAQMGHPIQPDEAKDMVESSREIREKIDSILAPAHADSEPTETARNEVQVSA